MGDHDSYSNKRSSRRRGSVTGSISNPNSCLDVLNSLNDLNVLNCLDFIFPSRPVLVFRRRRAAPLCCLRSIQ
jgi:hypothetical protein